jgi:hypothetical protein
MDLVGTSPRSQRDRTRREDRHLKFYELRDNLAALLRMSLLGIKLFDLAKAVAAPDEQC